MNTQSGSIQLLKNGLAKLGYIFEEYQIGESEFAILTSPRGVKWETNQNHIAYPMMDVQSRAICIDKQRSYDIVSQSGVRIPETYVVRSTGDVSDISSTIFNLLPRVVVKPVRGSLSRGVTINVENSKQLNDAFFAAQEISKSVIVQEQVSGEEIRFTVLNGTVVAALLRERPRVTGDGVSSVAQLLGDENTQRKKLRMPYLAYPQLDASIIDGRFLIDSTVPAKGEVVVLGHGTMIRSGASIYNVLPRVHHSYVEQAEKAAKALGGGFVVVDMFIHNYETPQSADNYAFIEFNSAPVLKLFYSCRDGRHFDIVQELVPEIDRSLHE